MLMLRLATASRGRSTWSSDAHVGCTSSRLRATRVPILTASRQHDIRPAARHHVSTAPLGLATAPPSAVPLLPPLCCIRGSGQADRDRASAAGTSCRCAERQWSQKRRAHSLFSHAIMLVARFTCAQHTKQPPVMRDASAHSSQGTTKLSMTNAQIRRIMHIDCRAR